MDVAAAERLLGVRSDASWAEVRRAYRERMRREHPDTRPDRDATEAIRLNDALRVLEAARSEPTAPWPRSSGSDPTLIDAPPVTVAGSSLARPAPDTITLTMPVDEAYRLTFEAAHDVGAITYVDRSGPIVEVLCRFVDQPATSLLITFQGRALHTELHCTVESIEARPPPPTEAVVDLLEDALRTRVHGP